MTPPPLHRQFESSSPRGHPGAAAPDKRRGARIRLVVIVIDYITFSSSASRSSISRIISTHSTHRLLIIIQHLNHCQFPLEHYPRTPILFDSHCGMRKYQTLTVLKWSAAPHCGQQLPTAACRVVTTQCSTAPPPRCGGWCHCAVHHRAESLSAGPQPNCCHFLQH